MEVIKDCMSKPNQENVRKWREIQMNKEEKREKIYQCLLNLRELATLDSNGSLLLREGFEWLIEEATEMGVWSKLSAFCSQDNESAFFALRQADMKRIVKSQQRIMSSMISKNEEIWNDKKQIFGFLANVDCKENWEEYLDEFLHKLLSKVIKSCDPSPLDLKIVLFSCTKLLEGFSLHKASPILHQILESKETFLMKN